MRGRAFFVAAVVAVLLLTPVVALLRDDAPRPRPTGTARAQAPVAAAAADVPLDAEDSRPLPKPRPKLVEPVAGQTALQVAGDAGGGVAVDGEDPAPSGPASSGEGVSPGAPSDEEVRSELDAMQRSQKRIRTLLRQDRFPISFGSGRVGWPVPGYTTISSPFGMRWGRLHAGIDIPAPVGTPIRAADSGTVVLAGFTGGYGNYTCIQHTRELSTCYGHQSKILVRPGQDVRSGQVIGLVGSTGNSTGPHLHFETRVDGRPIDPLRFL